MSQDQDSTPQPASGPMDKTTAEWYREHTEGQLQPFQHENGDWYLHQPEPEPVGVRPKTGTGETVQPG